MILTAAQSWPTGREHDRAVRQAATLDAQRLGHNVGENWDLDGCVFVKVCVWCKARVTVQARGLGGQAAGGWALQGRCPGVVLPVGHKRAVKG